MDIKCMATENGFDHPAKAGRLPIVWDRYCVAPPGPADLRWLSPSSVSPKVNRGLEVRIIQYKDSDEHSLSPNIYCGPVKNDL